MTKCRRRRDDKTCDEGPRRRIQHGPGLLVPHGEIVVTVGAGQGAAEGQLDGPIQGNPLASQAVLDTPAEIDVTL